MIGQAMSGLPRQYIMRAAEYWHAARVSKSAEVTIFDLFHPVGQMIGVATELSLKAFLLEKGLTPRTLWSKPYSHNLENLLIRAIENGAELALTEAQAVVVIHATHIDHYFRYGWVDQAGQVIGARKFPNFEICLGEIGNMIDRIARDPAIMRNIFKGSPTPFSWPPSLPLLHPTTADQIRKLIADFREEEKRLKAIVPSSSLGASS